VFERVEVAEAIDSQIGERVNDGSAANSGSFAPPLSPLGQLPECNFVNNLRWYF
jgi:hypothetical protein